MQILRTAILISGMFLLCSRAIVADKPKVYVLDSLPDEYLTTCKKYHDLQRQGLTVKAERLAENYRRKNLYPTFWLKAYEQRIYKIINPAGWYPSSEPYIMGTTDYVFYSVNTEDTVPRVRFQSTYGDPGPNAFILTIRKAKLEEWQDMLLKYFYRPEAEEGYALRLVDRNEWLITELTIRVKHSWPEDGSIVWDCFEEHRDEELILHGDATLLKYNLIPQKKQVEN